MLLNQSANVGYHMEMPGMKVVGNNPTSVRANSLLSTPSIATDWMAV